MASDFSLFQRQSMLISQDVRLIIAKDKFLASRLLGLEMGSGPCAANLFVSTNGRTF